MFGADDIPDLFAVRSVLVKCWARAPSVPTSRLNASAVFVTAPFQFGRYMTYLLRRERVTFPGLWTREPLAALLVTRAKKGRKVCPSFCGMDRRSRGSRIQRGIS